MKLMNIILSIILLAVVILGIFRIAHVLKDKQPIYHLDQASIIQEIRSLSRLETAVFTIEKIIEAEKDVPAFANILFGDQLLLIAHAQIIAGFDLSTITESDITVTETNITIDMPAPEIFSSNLNNEKTRVYDRTRGLLMRGDIDLESQARLAAETAIRADACESNILAVATENGRTQLTNLFKLAGFEEVVLNIPTGVCR